VPSLWKQLYLQHPPQIVNARGAACATFKPDDPLNRGDKVKAPAAEIVFEINKLFGQRLGCPMGFGGAVHAFPNGLDARVGCPRLREITVDHIFGISQAHAMKIAQSLMEKMGLCARVSSTPHAPGPRRCKGGPH
jgi:hypothetical protein